MPYIRNVLAGLTVISAFFLQ